MALILACMWHAAYYQFVWHGSWRDWCCHLAASKCRGQCPPRAPVTGGAGRSWFAPGEEYIYIYTSSTHWSQRICSNSFYELISTSWKIGLKWVPQNPMDDKSTLVSVMAWCHQASSHYASQSWPPLCRHMGSLCHNASNMYVLLLRFVILSSHKRFTIGSCHTLTHVRYCGLPSTGVSHSCPSASQITMKYLSMP